MIITSKSVRYNALDIWRGIVCLIVVLEHAGVALWPERVNPVSGEREWLRDSIVQSLSLNLGAPLFFVISGYCIATSLDSSRRKGMSPAIFLARRLWRIFPPYWASMTIIGILVVLLDRIGLRWLHQTDAGLELFAPSTFTFNQWLGNISLTETWRTLVISQSEPKLLNRVAWALCYQEQFYIVCFLALVFLPKRLYATLGWATLAIVGFRLIISDVGRELYYAGLFPDLWHQFAVGLFLYWRINVAETFWAKRAVEIGFVALFLFGTWHSMVTTQAAALFGLTLLGFHRWDAEIARITQFDALRGLGRRSYSVYLIHLPVCTVGSAALAAAGLSNFWLRLFVMIPLVTTGSVIAGWVFYACVDRHFGKLPALDRVMRLFRPRQAVATIAQTQV